MLCSKLYYNLQHWKSSEVKIYMAFDTIVEKVISELSDQVIGVLKGQQLQAYMTGKLEEIQASFIKCCGMENYFHDLDADMERKAFWDNLLRRFFSISKGESTELYVKGFCEGRQGAVVLLHTVGISALGRGCGRGYFLWSAAYVSGEGFSARGGAHHGR